MAEPAREDLPPCFGDSKLWDPKAKECVGGTDPAFTDENGGHVRGPCMFFEPCGVKAQAAKMEGARALLDPRSLVRKDIPVLSPSRPTQQPSQLAGFVDRFAQAVMNQPPQPVQQQSMFGRPMQQVQVPQGVAYQQMMPVNYQMPPYLTVPEQRHQGQSFWSFLGVTVFRSLGKSLGHSIAHLFDTVPLGTSAVDDGSQKGP